MKLWRVDGSLAFRAYFYSGSADKRHSALEALDQTMEDHPLDWSIGDLVEITHPSQIPEQDLRQELEVLLSTEGSPETLEAWVAIFDEIAEQQKQAKREAEAAARQLKLFGDDGT